MMGLQPLFPCGHLCEHGACRRVCGVTNHIPVFGDAGDCVIGHAAGKRGGQIFIQRIGEFDIGADAPGSE